MPILTDDEIRKLTGYSTRGRQARWLHTHWIPYEKRDGKLVVKSEDIPKPEKPRRRAGRDPAETPSWFMARWLSFWLPPSEIEERATRFPCPAPMSSGVYFLLQGPEIVYIGKSTSIFRRLLEHRENGDLPVYRVAWIEVHKHWAETVESFYVELYTPRLNILRGRGRFMMNLAERKLLEIQRLGSA